jgi:hypothetical protein
MIRPVPFHMMINKTEFVPQAIIAEAVSDFARRFGSDVEAGKDDFDEYEGVAAWLDDLPFTVMHYRGHPKNTSTIYLPFDIHDVKEITDMICRIALELKLPPNLIKWQRKDTPEL